DPPKEDDFKGDFLAYERAQTAYETEKRIVTREVKRAQAQQAARVQEASREADDDHLDRVEDLAKSIPNAREKLAKAARSAIQPKIGHDGMGDFASWLMKDINRRG